MDVFTVIKPGGIKDYEYEAYTRLLEDIGFDVDHALRVPEPYTHRRWLYAWRNIQEAEAFARELGHRTRDKSWGIYDCQDEEESVGPVAPLEIYEIRGLDPLGRPELTFYLSPRSRARILMAHTDLRLDASNSVRDPGMENIENLADFWREQMRSLTGLRDDQILALGGFRVILPYGKIGHEELPVIPAYV